MADKSAKAPPQTATAAPPGSAIDGKSGAIAAELKGAYRKFNDRMKLFIGDLVKAYGREYPGLGILSEQINMFTRLDPARMILAKEAWLLFDPARDMINKRDETLFTKHDIAGLKKRANLDTAVIWARATPKSKEAMWRSMEDLLDRLDEINDLRPIADDDSSKDDDEPPLLVSADEKKSTPTSTSNSSSTASVADPKPSSSSKKGRKKRGQKGVAQAMIGTLKKMVGGDAGMNDDFEQVMSKLNDPNNAEPTEKDQEIMTRLLTNFINRIAPGSGEEDDADLEGLPEKDRQAEKARRTIMQIKDRNKLKHAIGKLTMVEALQKTNDPEILQMDAKEAAAEKERLATPEASREYGITAHFNWKFSLILHKLLNVRGHVRSKKDGRVLFPAIKETFAKMFADFKENPGTTAYIVPVGEFISANRKKLNKRDDTVFLNTTDPFLLKFGAASIWKTFREEEREAFWDLAAHPQQLATIHHDLYKGDLSDIAGIIDDLLRSSGVAYDSDPTKIDGKKMIFDSIGRGCTPDKLSKIHKLFARMSSDPDQKTMRSISKLMTHIAPSALRARGIELDEFDSDDDNEDNPSGDDEDEAESKAKDADSERIQNRLMEMLSKLPSPPTSQTPAPAPAPQTLAPAPQTLAPAASTSSTSPTEASAKPAAESAK